MDEPDELRSLRERAYGPNPDIHDDPAALARLRELELARTRPAASDGAAPQSAEGDEDAAPAAATEPGAGADAAGRIPPRPAPPLARPAGAQPPDAADRDGGAPERPERPGRPRGRAAWVWAGALTAALVAGAGITYATMQARPGSAGSLGIDSTAAWPQNLGNRQNGSEIFEEFYGLRVVLAPQQWASGAATPCLFILPADRDASIIGAGCGAGDFAPVAAIEVTSRSPAALLAQFPEGSALQFELDGDRVVVYSHEP